MASREGQGLQIAVIMFAMLTIVLAITTYIFYASSEEARKARQDAEASKEQVEAQNKKLLYQTLQMKYVLGIGGVTQADIDVAKTAAGGDDPVVTEVDNAFKADMALFGDQVAPDVVRNYRTLPGYLLKEVNRKHDDMAVAQQERAAAEAAKTQTAAADAGRVATAEASIKKATDDLAAEQAKFTEDRNTLTAAKEEIASRLAKKDGEMKKQTEEYQKNLTNITLISENAQKLSTSLRTKVEELEKGSTNLFENPDGRITWVNQKQRLVWINLGRADALEKQTTFSVYDHDENGVSNAESKGRIEVVAIKDDHLAECRILEDEVSNPILPNDIIHSPAWSPGQRIHFALAGFMDINGDHVSDRALIRNIITLNGGVIDAELTDDGKRTGNISVGTRYLVIGDKPTEKVTAGGSLNEYSNMIGQAQQYGAEQISVQDLLDRMGWKAEERTVELGGRRSSTADFRKRTPGSKAAPVETPAAAAPAAAEPAAAPATGTPAPAAEVVDPFK